MAEITQVEVALSGPVAITSVVISEAPGADGAPGTNGADGADGADGVGVPVGGTTGQVLAKVSGTDYDTEWVAATAGSGDVVGPASAVTARIATYNGTTGKLIADGGSTIANVLDRANHTSTQAISTVTGLQTALDAKAASSHTHAISDTTGLQTALDGKASSSHTHAAGDITGLATSATTDTTSATNITSGTLPIARIADGDVTLAKLANLAQSVLVGRYTASTGVPQTITVGSDFSLSGGTLSLSANPANASNLTTGTIGAGVTIPWEIQLAASDETTDLTTGTAKVTFRMPWAATLSTVRASVTTAPTGSTLVVDINENTGSGATTILSTKLSIDASEKTSTTAATAAVISDTTLADDAEITIDIDQVGSSVAGAGLKITLKGTRTI